MNSTTRGMFIHRRSRFLPPNQDFVNTIVVYLRDQIREVTTNEDGSVIHKDLYPQVSLMRFHPTRFSRDYIFRRLHRSIENIEVCKGLSLQAALMSHCFRAGPFVLRFEVDLKREVQIGLPTDSDNALHKLMEDLRIESTDLKEVEEDICSICLEKLMESTLENHANIVKLRNCIHMFHEDCVFKWFKRNKKSCPLCRSMPFEKETQR